MTEQDAFERIMAALYASMLDDSRWPTTSALIDEVCGLAGNALVSGEGPKEDRRVRFVGLYYRGHPRPDLERDYLEHYLPIDERASRFRQMPDGGVVHSNDMFTAEERKTSPVHNEYLPRSRSQNSLVVRMDLEDRAHMAWNLADPVAPEGWESSRVTMVKRLVPHVQQFVRVRQALVRAGAGDTTVTALLDNSRVGVVHLDQRGRILAANDRARSILPGGDGLIEEDGALAASAPEDQLCLDRLLASALPTGGDPAIGGSMRFRRRHALLPLVVHVKPVPVPQPSYGARYVAALALIHEPGFTQRIEPALVAATLELTPGESQVAVWLAEGKSVEEMAKATGHTRGAIYWHLKQIYQKLHISRQADLVRLVLSVAEFG